MKVNCFIFTKLIKLLMEGTRSCAELAEETGLHKLTVYQYTKEFHKAGLVHIATWENNAYGRPSIRIYMWGPGKDATRTTLPRNEIHRRYKERQRKTKMINIMSEAA